MYLLCTYVAGESIGLRGTGQRPLAAAAPRGRALLATGESSTLVLLIIPAACIHEWLGFQTSICAGQLLLPGILRRPGGTYRRRPSELRASVDHWRVTAAQARLDDDEYGTILRTIVSLALLRYTMLFRCVKYLPLRWRRRRPKEQRGGERICCPFLLSSQSAHKRRLQFACTHAAVSRYEIFVKRERGEERREGGGRENEKRMPTFLPFSLSLPCLLASLGLVSLILQTPALSGEQT